MNAIAIVGLACVYPDARTPGELWENVLAQRRAFRRLPTERLRAEDFFSANPGEPDRTYSIQAAVIEGYEFDRVAFRVAGSTFRSTDLTHWLALDIASKALADAGFADGAGLPRESTGVLVGNTLTGEFTRANLMRLRWPYVRRVLAAALEKESWPPERREKFLAELEADYKSPFPPVGEESLAGGLSNTIAGRICNHFDLKGGGFTVDGACASSLLAVANACSALVAGDLDVALAGGVDLSLDPFELVGFAKTGALAPDEMRVFDQRSAGFWPGEGCGFVTLMRHEDALAEGRRIYATIRGWGISSDGAGGLTRPESEGQAEALRRAYRRAGFGIDTVTYCEGHGTGTAVGDATELGVLARARHEAKAGSPPAVIGSIKANIGHTKAAAGLAGLIKATMAVHTQVLPPTTGCEQPHAQLAGPAPALRVLREPEVWPADRPLRASVSAMGFGGINAHVALEGGAAERRTALSPREHFLARARQDAELFLLAADTLPELLGQVNRLLAVAGRLSRSDLTDAAAQLAHELGIGPWRAALTASQPDQLSERLQTLKTWLALGIETRLDFNDGVFLGFGKTPPRIGYLFPGQGSPTPLDGGAWRRRFETVRDVYSSAGLPADGDAISTRVAQPAVVTASLAGLRLLAEFGVAAEVAAGHSLGEITALHWAGAFDEATLVRIAELRGEAMAELGSPTGAMLAIAAPWQETQTILTGRAVTIVGYNSPRQTVVAGDAADVTAVARLAEARAWPTTLLPVSHAFHTPLVAAALPVLAEELARLPFAALRRPVVSTITGAPLAADENLRELLGRQVTSPVRFNAALMAMLDGSGWNAPRGRLSANRPTAEAQSRAVDLLIEVGPGQVLAGLTRETTDVPVVSLDAGGGSLKGLLGALGAAFALGTPVRHARLFADRFTRRFDFAATPNFFGNPCELAPVPETVADILPGKRTARAFTPVVVPAIAADGGTAVLEPIKGKSGNPVELVRQLVAERAELPVSAVRDESRMLSDLHLNSITVGQLVSEAARQLGLPRLVELTDFANATVAEMARALEELQRTGGGRQREDRKRQPPGVGAWFETFAIALVETKRSAAPRRSNLGDGSGWRIFASKKHPLAAKLRKALAQTGDGVALCLPENPGEGDIALMLAAARAVMALKSEPRFLLVQHGWGGGGFARTLHLETPGLTTCVVNVPPKAARAVEWIRDEALAAKDYVEAHYDTEGRRFEPRLQWQPPGAENAEREALMFSPAAAKEGKKSKAKTKNETGLPIGPGDVLLVTGGGKGIAAECALALGRTTGAALALLGRSDPKSDQGLAENLARIMAAGVKCCYVRGDVTDAKSIRAAVAQAEKRLGPVTALLHGAGANTPQLIGALDEAAFRRTVAPKIRGARNALAAVNAARLKLLVTFGSIIARAGLRGEADYATANEWLTALTEQFQTKHPRCRCVALEWSVWSGVGMGERLGRVETLTQQGITPIPPDEGVRILLETLRRPAGRVAVVVTGRFGEPATLKPVGAELPLRRFLERKRAFYPGVELVVDAELSVEADPYLNDHVVQKQRLFPAVLGIEAMAQAAMALTGSNTPPAFEKLELRRPIAVANKRVHTIRVAALRRGPGLVEVCVRSEETDFQVDHFRAFCRFEANPGGITARLAVAPPANNLLALDPAVDLYGRILFHQGRFCRLRGYHVLQAKECVAEITADDGARWFGPYLPGEFVLGNPAARDAALHAIQACIPHQRILPTGIDSLVVRRLATGPRLARARERERRGNDFVYDVEVTTPTGEVLERWMGLRLRAVELMPAREAWPTPLLGPYLERRLEELMVDSRVSVSLERTAPRAADRSDAVMQRALGRQKKIWRRPDGKPVTTDDDCVSAAHAQNLTLAVARRAGVACDLETVVPRSDAAWRDLLGDERLKMAEHISRDQSETTDLAATRVWSALECLKKAGVAAQSPLVLDSVTRDGWVVLRSGALRIATAVALVCGATNPLVVAVAIHSPIGAEERAGVRATI